MRINTKNLVSMTDANQNFSKVAHLVDENGAAIILKNNKPRYILMAYDADLDENVAKTEDIESVSRKMMKKYSKAFKVLAE
jgi:antitoxin Phd